MKANAKRTRGAAPPIDPRQQDLFTQVSDQIPAPPSPPPVEALPAAAPAKPKRAPKPSVRKSQAPPPAFGAEDWWTTRSVCAFLKIGRKALWNMRRDPKSDFPAPVDAVGHRHLYLASEVRAWMDGQRESARRRAEDRRQTLAQFSSGSPR